MRCTFCDHLEDRVVDSRTGKNGEIIRRRRACLRCGRRFTTYERVEEVVPTVVKKDGRRAPFDRLKILAGIQKACQKRPVASAAVEALVQQIENELLELGEKEIPSAAVGQRVMAGLQGLDEVAYVRFAAVYRQFKDIGEFMAELKGILDGRAARAPGPRACRPTAASG